MLSAGRGAEIRKRGRDLQGQETQHKQLAGDEHAVQPLHVLTADVSV